MSVPSSAHSAPDTVATVIRMIAGILTVARPSAAAEA